MSTRVVVIDNNRIARRGCVDFLADDPTIMIVDNLDHDQALARQDWGGVDVVIVDAADERRRDDHYPGVAVVEAIRRSRSPDETRIIVLTARYFDSGLRRRMREAQADRFYNRFELECEPRRLLEATLGTDLEDNGDLGVTPDEMASLASLGITPRSRVNDALAFSKAAHLDEILADHVKGLPRRAMIALRRRFNEVAQLEPINVATGERPRRDIPDSHHLPSRKQIEQFLAVTQKVDDPPSGTETP